MKYNLLKNMKEGFRWNIRTRLFLQVGIIICLFAFLIMILNICLLEKFYVSNERSMLIRQADYINNLDISNYEDSALELEEIEKTHNVLIVIYEIKGIEGYVKYYTNMDFSLNRRGIGQFSYVLNNDVISQEEYTDGSVYEVQQDNRMSVQYMVYKKQLNNGDVLDIRVIKNTVSKSVALANKFMLYITGVGVIGLLIWAYLYSRRFTGPIVEMNNITRSMANLDFTRKCRVESDDEIGELSQSINELSSSLGNALEDLKVRNEQLQFDIERERSLDHMRKEFVSNVSHELKTPISIILGYAEGLRLNVIEDEEKKNYYSEVIGEEANKMNNLVHGLLQLSHYESGQFQLTQQEFNITELINSVISKYQPIFDENSITVSTSLDNNSIVFADPLRIEQVITNYLNNAISHVNEKKQIMIKGVKLGDKYKISVFNTGNKIPNEELDNIWLSFYRTDKARSRENGRYGLGLSIVRAIMDLHKNKYGAENWDNGVEFWFELESVNNSLNN